MLDAATIINILGWAGIIVAALFKWKDAIVMAWGQWRGTGTTAGKVLHIGEFSVMRRPSDSGDMRDRLDIIVCGDEEEDNATTLSTNDKPVSDIEMTSLSTTSTLAAIEASCVSSIVGDWAGKKLNATAIVSMAAQLIPAVETLMAELKQQASTESTQQVVTSVITQVLTRYSQQIDPYVTEPVASLLQELLPTLIGGLFAVSEDVEKEASSCFSCVSTKATTAPTTTIRPVHRLLAQNAAPSATTVTVSSATPSASPSSPAAAGAPVAAAGAPPIFFGKQ